MVQRSFCEKRRIEQGVRNAMRVFAPTPLIAIAESIDIRCRFETPPATCDKAVNNVETAVRTILHDRFIGRCAVAQESLVRISNSPEALRVRQIVISIVRQYLSRLGEKEILFSCLSFNEPGMTSGIAYIAGDYPPIGILIDYIFIPPRFLLPE